MITVTLNGKLKEFANNITVLELLNAYSLKPSTVIVELNRKIIEIDEFNTQLNNNDIIELINFVGGG